MRELKERRRIESEFETEITQKPIGKIGKVTGRRKLPLRVKLRRMAAAGHKQEPQDKNEKLSVIVKGMMLTVCYIKLRSYLKLHNFV